MASNHIKVVFQGLKDTLENDDIFSPYLNRVWSFYAQGYNGYTVVPEQLTIMLELGDSSEEEPFTNEPTNTDILPTEIIITCDTVFSDDANMFLSEDNETFLDLEYELIRSLQSDAWWNAETHFQGWAIESIQRDVLVLDRDGNQDYDTRRFIVTLVVDMYLDRTDGPAR